MTKASLLQELKHHSFCRPNEGTLQLHVDLSPMAAPGLDSSRSAGEEPTSEVQAMLEKAIRNIKAVDLETLCIVAGRQVDFPQGRSLRQIKPHLRTP